MFDNEFDFSSTKVTNNYQVYKVCNFDVFPISLNSTSNLETVWQFFWRKYKFKPNMCNQNEKYLN